MIKYMMAFVLTFGLLIIGFSTPATATCVEACLEYDSTECVCSAEASEYNSRGDCISTLLAEDCAGGSKGEYRKNCNAGVKDFCDCAVYHGCTDLPPGPSECEDGDGNIVSPPGPGSLIITNTCQGLVIGTCSSGRGVVELNGEFGACYFDAFCVDSDATCVGGSNGRCSVTGEGCVSEECCITGFGCLTTAIPGL